MSKQSDWKAEHMFKQENHFLNENLDFEAENVLCYPLKLLKHFSVFEIWIFWSQSGLTPCPPLKTSVSSTCWAQSPATFH